MTDSSKRTGLVTLSVALVLSAPGAGPARAQSEVNPLEAAQAEASATIPEHMPESVRASIRKIVVIPGAVPARSEVTGTYEENTPGLIGGMDEGARKVTIEKDIGPIPVSFPIPYLTLPAQILGGITGVSKRELQEFRDALTEELADAAGQPLSSEKLAADVFWGLRELPSLDSKLFAPTTPIPEDTDAVLFVGISGLEIEVQGKEAIITTSALATVRRLSDGRDIYERTVRYQDRAELGDWTRNDNALWRDYANYSRHFLGRELTSEAFDRVKLNHSLVPQKTNDVKIGRRNAWQGESKSMAPTLAWELELHGGDTYGSWADELDAADVTFDLEIYDLHEPVYEAKNLSASSHTLPYELPACGSYRWTVRPRYHVDGEIKYGEWMRSPNEDKAEPGLDMVGREASIAPAYLQDFAILDIDCGRR